MSFENHSTSTHRQLLIITLKVLCVSLFIGRAWQHLFWDIPIRALLWDEALLMPLVEGLTSLTWHEYVTSSFADRMIQYLIKFIGVLFAAFAVITVFLKSSRSKLRRILPISSALLIFLAFLYTKEHFYHLGQFFEYSAQFMTPLFLYFVLHSEARLKKYTVLIKVALALTFICHGLYAINFYPRPGNFVDMTINILGVSESIAHTLLFYAGVLDFIVAILIFIPRVVLPALYYMFVWGFMTSAARIAANLYSDFFWESLHQWWFEFAYRMPHAGLPLLLIFIIKETSLSKKTPQLSTADGL